MKAHQMGWALPVVFGLASLALADDALTPIAAVVNQQTIIVVRVDMAGIDFDAWEKWANQSIAQSTQMPANAQADAIKQIHEGWQASRDWVGRFTKAGGKTLWIVVTNFQNNAEPKFIAVPLPGDADVAAMKEVFRDGQKNNQPDKAEDDRLFAQVGNILVVGANAAAIKEMRAQARPDLAKALAAAAPGVVQIAFVPSADFRKTIEDFLPPLPDGQPPTVLTQAVSSVTIWLRAVPQIGAKLVCQSPDNASALKLYNVLKVYADIEKQTIKSTPASDPLYAPQTIIMAVVDDLLAKAQVDGDKLVVDFDSQKLGAAGSAAAQTILHARAAAQQIASDANIKQIFQSLQLYAGDNHHAFPESLDDLAQYFEKTGITVGDMMTNPAHPEQKSGYVYVKPAQGDKTPADHIILYEKYDAFGQGILVCFFDGHSEFIKNEAAFKKLLAVAEGTKK